MVKKVPFDFQKASGYTPYHTVFVHSQEMELDTAQLTHNWNVGQKGIGTNVDLLNSLTPYKQPIYYYVKQEPVTVTPEVENNLKDVYLLMVNLASRLKKIKKINHYQDMKKLSLTKTAKQHLAN